MIFNNLKTITSTFAVGFLIINTPALRAQDQVPYAPYYLKIGGKLPQFDMRTMKGNRRNTESLQHNVSVIFYWYIGSPPCVEEIRHLNKLENDFNKRGLQVLGFARNSPGELRDFYNSESEQYDWVKTVLKADTPVFEVMPLCKEVLKQDDNACPYLSDSIGVVAYPTTVLVDKRGLVRFIKVGFATPKGPSNEENGKLHNRTTLFMNELKQQLELLLQEPDQ